MLYHWTAAQLGAFTRAARKVERSAKKVGGSPFDPILFLGKMAEAFLLAISAPEGGRIHFLLDIPVDEDEDWVKAWRKAGPSNPTGWADYMDGLGHLYPPSGMGTVRKDFVLVHHPDWLLKQYLSWAAENHLGITAGQDAFAVARKKANLNREVGTNPLYLCATSAKYFEDIGYLLSVEWKDDKGGAYLTAGSCWVEDLDEAPPRWCLFSRERAF